ncbi:hypothetical protein KC887_06520 [Candidatus Kaiserbacteria bacterium]|nr:hypothetical protein [Candidatus Kaiserbacteria bacterium]
MLVRFWSPKYHAWGVHHEVYNPPPEWHEPDNPELSMPGMFLAEDALACALDLPGGCSNAADDVAMITAIGGVIACPFTSGATCLTVADNISFVAGGFGSGVTAYNWRTEQQNATRLDTFVSLATTSTGLAIGSRGGGLVGAGLGIVQRIYDYWTNRQ